MEGYKRIREARAGGDKSMSALDFMKGQHLENPIDEADIGTFWDDEELVG